MSTFVITAVLVLLLLAAFRLWLTANRLDRLHIRTEAAWVALVGALSRRISAARAAAGGYPPAEGERLRELTAVADRAPRSRRADAENDLTRALNEMPPAEPGAAGELADAAERIALARSFYNDAVRDTRALRDVRFTRMLRLAGRAALPDYFEIADPTPPLPVLRTAARVVLVRPDASVLMFCTTASGRPVWFTPGGGLEPGEELPQAAVRELREETGLELDPQQLTGPIWRRRARFEFLGQDHLQTEHYFVAAAPDGFVVNTAGFDSVERTTIGEHRWWTVHELSTTTETIYPVELAARMPEVTAALAAAHHDLVDIT